MLKSVFEHLSTIYKEKQNQNHVFNQTLLVVVEKNIQVDDFLTSMDILLKKRAGNR
jgi:hypothetical protein